MPFEKTRPDLVLSAEQREELTRLSRCRTEPMYRVERARILLACANGETPSVIARQMRTNRVKVYGCIRKALEVGPKAALDDLPGRGRPPKITSEDRTWIVSLACQKPKELGYSYELWTIRLLMAHVQRHCEASGHGALRRVGTGTISDILANAEIHPHKIRYYLERRDPDFEAKMAQVLCVYRDVELLRQKGEQDGGLVAILSYDDKPGIQALEGTAPDLPPVPGKYPTVARDYEYVRHGTVSLLAGIDLLTGYIHGQVVDRHRSREIVAFLMQLHSYYPAATKIRIVMDNHSAHISKETRTYLATVPNRFEFIFTPKHGSWLNLIESFFGKMAKSMLRGIRVKSKQELKDRIMQYLAELNAAPVVFRWGRQKSVDLETRHDVL